MFDSTAPNHANPAPAPAPGLGPGLDPGVDPGVACQLPADAYYHLIRTLRLTLPPPPGDAPDDLLRRDHAAIARIAALAPANAAEADLAAQFVAASEQWKDCLRLAQAPGTTPEWAAKCRAQALAMMRQSNSALRLLLRLQDAREKREADSAACDRAAWTEHCAIGLMAEALAANPHPNPLPQGEGALSILPLPLGEGRGEGDPARARREAEAPPPPLAPPPPGAEGMFHDPRQVDEPAPAEAGADLIAAAERYAALYPERAASIRRTGRLPHDIVYFCPPEAALVPALITARTPTLAALDSAPAAARAA